MNNINFNSKINLPIIGEVDLNDYFINSISIKNDVEKIYMGWDDNIGRDVITNYRLIIGNDYFEFEILHLNNRDKKEILYLFDIFKQLTKYEIDFWHYRELQEVIEDRYCKYVYKYDEEWIDYNYKKWKIHEEIEDILKHLEEEFDIDIDFEFSAIDYTFSKIEIGFQKRS